MARAESGKVSKQDQTYAEGRVRIRIPADQRALKNYGFASVAIPNGDGRLQYHARMLGLSGAARAAKETRGG